MSGLIYIYLKCDAYKVCQGEAWDDAPDPANGLGGDDDQMTLTNQRRLARKEGWHVGLPGGRDICDRCWKAGSR